MTSPPPAWSFGYFGLWGENRVYRNTWIQLTGTNLRNTLSKNRIFSYSDGEEYLYEHLKKGIRLLVHDLEALLVQLQDQLDFYLT